MDVTNLKGEQGGVFLAAADSYTATGQADYLVGFICLSDTTLTSITMDGFGGTESELVGPTLIAGTPVFGQISEITVASGLVQGLKH